MLRNVALALVLLLVAAAPVAAAGPIKFALTPTDSASSASGTLRINNGKPTDTICSVHLSLSGLAPDHSYYLKVYGPDRYEWSLGIFTDENGSCRVVGTATNQILSATSAEIADGFSSYVVMVGTSQ